MKKYRFFMADNKWWIDVPSYTGKKEDLEMTHGADVVLTWLAENKKEITLEMSDKEFKDSRPMYKTERPCDEGSYYLFAATDYISDHWGFWFSDAMKFIFGKFPNVIYYKLAEDEKVPVKRRRRN